MILTSLLFSWHMEKSFTFFILVNQCIFRLTGWICKILQLDAAREDTGLSEKTNQRPERILARKNLKSWELPTSPMSTSSNICVCFHLGRVTGGARESRIIVVSTSRRLWSGFWASTMCWKWSASIPTRLSFRRCFKLGKTN